MKISNNKMKICNVKFKNYKKRANLNIKNNQKTISKPCRDTM
jgi:hypothetical protein